MGRGNTEIVEVFRAKPVAQNSILTLSSDFPLGGGWTRLIIRLNHAVTIGTGTGAITEGELAITKSISFRTDKGERIYNNVPGRALYRLNEIKNRAPGVKSAIAAASATYTTQFELHFADPQSLRPYDTILDTSRYRSVELAVQIGGVADFFSTVGTSSNVTTMDCYVERVSGALPDGAKPLFFNEVSVVAPVNPANATVIDLERASNLALKRVLISTNNSATSGVPFSGTATANVVSEFSLETSEGIPFRNLPVGVINSDNRTEYGHFTVVTGQYILDLVKDGSNRSALPTGDLSRLQVKWVNDTLSTSQVSLITEGLRELVA